MISSIYEKIIGSHAVTNNKPNILCVGLVCLDIVQTCSTFPAEDSDTRCIDYRWQRGGNASNNCTVLSKLGSNCEFFGPLSAENHLNFLLEDMNKYGINYSHCPTIFGTACPVSTVILSLSTGSRTILHHNPGVPELTLEDFQKLNLEDYSWIHFEGRRNVPAILAMMQQIEGHNADLKQKKSDRIGITISVELEKTDSQLLDLLPYTDVAFISKDFARSQGFSNMSETIRGIARDVKSGGTIICAWGDRGAMARAPNGTIVQSPPFSPPKIVDSLGAGDTFISAILHYLNSVKLSVNSAVGEKNIDKNTRLNDAIARNFDIESLECSETNFISNNILQATVTFACRTAGAKIGFVGYDGIQKYSI